MKKTIVIFSNPFGYGPTGKAIAIAEAFLRKGISNIVFAGSNFVQEIIPDSVTSISVDERDEGEIIKMLGQIENPMVISSQNRFAIRAAKSLGIPSAFLDGLAWFWKDIPDDHLIADEIFWMNYPDIKEKLTKHSDKINIVPAIIDIKTHVNKRDQTLIHIGGCKNPLVDIFPKFYLTILAESLSHITGNVIVTGGIEATEYLKSLLVQTGNKTSVLSLKHNEFITELGKSKHFITTAGQTATLEAFAMGIPTSFLMPMNLSQLALTDILAKYDAAPQVINWDSYFLEKIDITSLNEKDTIVELGKHAERICRDEESKHRMIIDLVNLLKIIPNNKGQTDFIEYMGVSGADVIADILIKKGFLK